MTKTMSETQIKDLCTTRQQGITDLEGLLGGVQLTDVQVGLVRNKMEYAKGNKLPYYANNFFGANKITTTQRDYINALATKADNAIIEYDSVVNQLMLFMHVWQVPQGNPFYVKVMALASDAYDLRKLARDG